MKKWLALTLMWIVLLVPTSPMSLSATQGGPGARGVARPAPRKVDVSDGVYLFMTTWSTGRRRLTAIVKENTLPFDLFLPDISRRKPPRMPRT